VDFNNWFTLDHAPAASPQHGASRSARHFISFSPRFQILISTGFTENYKNRLKIGSNLEFKTWEFFFKNHDKSVKIFENRSKSLKTEAAAEVVVTGVMFAAEVKNRSRRQGYLFLSSLRVWYRCPNR
jgi:hypothetical protein